MKVLSGYLPYFSLDRTSGAAQNPKKVKMEDLHDWLEESLPDEYNEKVCGNQVDLIGSKIESVVDYL